MANRDTLRVSYRLEFEAGGEVRFELELDGATLKLERVDQPTPPNWAKLAAVGCSVCELAAADDAYCPVATSLVEVVDRFGGYHSFDKVRVEVTTAERIVSARPSAGVFRVPRSVSAPSSPFSGPSGRPSPARAPFRPP